MTVNQSETHMSPKTNQLEVGVHDWNASSKRVNSFPRVLQKMLTFSVDYC